MQALAEKIQNKEEIQNEIDTDQAVKEFLDYLAMRLAEEYISILQNLKEQEE
ncbi:hypothetical protein JXA40_01850 [bacterium]|nr:hypothetical protein [candidate division CSSED10-310 bacterium]